MWFPQIYLPWLISFFHAPIRHNSAWLYKAWSLFCIRKAYLHIKHYFFFSTDGTQIHYSHEKKISKTVKSAQSLKGNKARWQAEGNTSSFWSRLFPQLELWFKSNRELVGCMEQNHPTSIKTQALSSSIVPFSDRLQQADSPRVWPQTRSGGLGIDTSTAWPLENREPIEGVPEHCWYDIPPKTNKRPGCQGTQRRQVTGMALRRWQSNCHSSFPWWNLGFAFFLVEVVLRGCVPSKMGVGWGNEEIPVEFRSKKPIEDVSGKESLETLKKPCLCC